MFRVSSPHVSGIRPKAGRLTALCALTALQVWLHWSVSHLKPARPGTDRRYRGGVVPSVRRKHLAESSEAAEDLAYWLSRTPAERIAAVEHLRRTHVGGAARLQRSARVVRRP